MDLITNGVSWLMPPQHERKSPSLHLVLSNVLPWFALYGLLSAFCRRPNTRLQRMLLGPILFFWGVRLSLGTKWCPPDDLGGNVVATMVFISLSFRALVFGLSPQSQKKVDEKIPGERHLHPPSIFHQFYWYIEDALDLSCTIRGVNYDFGSGSGLKLPVDKSIRQKYAKDGRKWAWLMHTFVYRVLPKFIMTDIINHLNLVISHFGGPDAFQKATLLQRLAIESWTFFLIVFNLGYLYDLVSILGVGIACNDISNWPPMFDQPWLSTSLHEFWAVRWHQVSP
ncbi:hypothetical protein FRC03_001259 [Tulasnella sp. 419]|nr:hypothetical protein FRC03_001259 [Tulasnella sp. 419]